MPTAQRPTAPPSSSDAVPARDEGPRAPSYLSHGRGVLSWLFTLDHKRIGLMYLAGIGVAALVGTALAVLLRTEMLSPGVTVLTVETFGVVFTLHGAVMVFLVLLPSIPAAFGIFVAPMMLGATNVAFPRLTLFGFHAWLLGAGSLAVSSLLGAIDTGWTFYPPYTTHPELGTHSAVIPALVGVLLLGCSAALNGLGLIATLHKKRPRSLPWLQMPLFLWTLYCTAVVQVLVTPALCVAILLLVAERLYGIGMVDPALGGDPQLMHTLFWLYSHPAVFIMILPAMGVVTEIICVYARRRIVDYASVAISSVAVAVLTVLGFGQHAVLSGQSDVASAVFSAFALLVVVPYGVVVTTWLATLLGGRIWLATPMLYALAFVLLFPLGALAGTFLGALGTHVHLHDTYFDVARLHYFLVGGTSIGFLGALHHWWPKMTGRMYSEGVARIGCFLVFAGINATFFPMLVLGARGMPRRHYDYSAELQWLQQLCTVGSYLLVLGLAGVSACLLHSLLRGRQAPANPWEAETAEWQTDSPPAPAACAAWPGNRLPAG